MWVRKDGLEVVEPMRRSGGERLDVRKLSVWATSVEEGTERNEL